MRLTIVQYAGDYREAHERFARGGKANYQAQRYAIEAVAALTGQGHQVTVVAGITDQPYDVLLDSGVRAIGGGLPPGFDPRQLVGIVAGTQPELLSIHTPLPQLLAWAARRRIRTLAVLADSFDRDTIKARWNGWRIARLLNRPNIEFVANHGLNACLSLFDIGVERRKVIPWDWPPAFSPHDREPRTRRSGPFRIVYVGAVSEEKGVGDLLDALAIVRDRGRRISATIYGNDHGGAMAAKADRLQLGALATFGGVIANEDVVGAMESADAVVVASRHASREGLPLTIYEALSSRTPILASDHPMFRGALTDGVNAVIFPASAPAAMADAIVRLSDDADLYQRLSRNGAAAWDRLQLPVAWGSLLHRWAAGDREWLAAHAVGSGRYDARLAERKAAMAGR